MAMDDVQLQVQAEAHLCCDLDLDLLCAKAFTNCELARNPKAQLVINARRTRATIKLKADGEASITCIATADEARAALKRAARRCKQFGWPVKFKRFKVSLVRWLKPYRPNFTIDVLELGKHPLAEIRQNSTQAGALRVLLPCGSLGGGAPKGGAGRPRPRLDFDDDGNPVTRSQEGGEDGAPDMEDEGPVDAGVWAEVSADGRTRFHGALSLDELRHALDVTVPILEKYKIEDLPDMGRNGGNNGGGPARSGGARGRFRSTPLSREAMELEEPMAFGQVMPSQAAAAAVWK